MPRSPVFAKPLDATVIKRRRPTNPQGFRSQLHSSFLARTINDFAWRHSFGERVFSSGFYTLVISNPVSPGQARVLKAMWPFERLENPSVLGGDYRDYQSIGPVYIATESKIDASICKPPCECADCQHGFYTSEEQRRPEFSYRGGISDPDARRIAAEHVRNAQQDREYLLQRLASHADVIVNQWKKKSQVKRQELLVNAVPGLYEHRWLLPRFAYSDEPWMLDDRSLVRRCQLLLPWLNLEVLKTNAAVLFGLLHNRTAYTLQDWTPYDSRQLIPSWACGHFNVEYSSKCVVMHGRKYGELVDWQEGPAHRADIMGFPRARLVLEAQAYLMNALRKIVDKILESVDLSKPATSEKWKLMTSFGFKHTGEVELWWPYTNQAFSAPLVFDVNNLISIAQTRLNDVGDHLWLLQTEPAYMRRYIRVLFQGEFYKVVRPDEEGGLLINELYTDVLTYWFWYWIKIECEHVKRVHDRFRDSVCQGEPLPATYDRALGALEFLLVNLVTHKADRLMEVVPQRPGFRHHWNLERRRGEGGLTDILISRKTKTETKKLFYIDPLDWCLCQLHGAPDKQRNFDHAMLFAFLQNHLASSSAKEKARVDEILYQKLSDLAACHEMLVSVRLHRPQNKFRERDELLQSEDRESWRAWKRMKHDQSMLDMTKLGTALIKDFYNAPLPGGQKNAMWLKRSKAIRRALEAFWTGLRERSRKLFQGSDLNPEEVSAILQIISANRSPEYIDAVQAEYQQVLISIESALARTTIPTQKEWGPTPAAEPVGPVSEPKIKTRPTEQPESTEEIENKVDDMTLSSPPEIPIKKRAYDVFTLMFPSTAEEASKSVEWNFFVHAMSDVGFAARNGGGSAVVFENVGLVEGVGGAGGKIVFHKPHPVAKIDPTMLHSMGKRMMKWFGLRREVFVLEK